MHGTEGAHYRILRREANMRLRQVAEAVDITPQYLQQLETGKHQMTQEVRIKLDQFFAGLVARSVVRRSAHKRIFMLTQELQRAILNDCHPSLVITILENALNLAKTDWGIEVATCRNTKGRCTCGVHLSEAQKG